MSNINDVIDTENWVMKVGRIQQHDAFTASVPGYDADPSAFWISEFAEKEQQVFASDGTPVSLFSQWVAVGPAGEQAEAHDTIETAQAAGFPSTQLFWFWKP